MADSSLRVQDTEGVTLVSFRDASILDAMTIQQIGRELYELVESQGKLRVILDFSDVRFMSSQALGVLLTLRRKAEKTGAKVVLCAVRPELERVFKITNLDRMFDFFSKSADAVARLTG